MKVLLDENLPHVLRHFLAMHEVYTVAYMKWSGVKNGRLLRLAADDAFDAFITMDDALSQQNPVADVPIAIVVIHAATNTIDDLKPLVPALLRTISNSSPRTVTHVGP